MDRRLFLRRTGVVAVPASLGLAGCSDGESGVGDDTADDGGTAEQTTEAADTTGGGGDTPTSEDGETTVDGDRTEPTPAGSLSVVDVDTDSVDERRAFLQTVTVENDDQRTRSGVVEGAVDVEGAIFTQRRGVTVPGGETAMVALKISYESDRAVVTTTGSASISDDSPGAFEGSLDVDPAEELLVVDAESESLDAPQFVGVTVRVRNLVDRPRTATVVAEVDLDDGDSFTDQAEVTVPGGQTQESQLTVGYESDDSFVTYSTTAWVE